MAFFAKFHSSLLLFMKTQNANIKVNFGLEVNLSPPLKRKLGLGKSKGKKDQKGGKQLESDRQAHVAS